MGFRLALRSRLRRSLLALALGAGPGLFANPDAALIRSYREAIADPECNLPILLSLDAAALLAGHLQVGVQVVRAGPGPE